MLFWDEIAGVYTWWGVPWCIGGDFIVNQFTSERSGVHRLILAMEEFLDFIFELELLDLPLAGVL